MKLLTTALLSAAVLLITPPSGQAQNAKGVAPGHKDIHRSINSVEAEIRSLIDSNETITKRAIPRAQELRQLNRDLLKADKDNRNKYVNRIQDLLTEEKLESVNSRLNSIAIQRLQLELDELNRYDGHIIEGGDRQPGPGNSRPARTPQIRSIKVLKTERGDPVRVNGKGNGHYTTILYEVLFTDGSRQRVESKEFSTQKNR